MQGMMISPFQPNKSLAAGIAGGGGIILFIIISLIIGGGVFWYINFSSCKNYECPDGYGIVDDAESISGYDEDKCCTQIKCYGNVDQTKDYTCEGSTILKGDASKITTISQGTCCESSGVSISTKFTESWNDLSELQREFFINSYVSFISTRLNVLESDIVIQDGYPKEGSTIIVCKVTRDDITKDTINQELTGIESEGIGGLTVLSVSVKDTNYEAELEISSSYVPSSSSGCSDSRYKGVGCSKCSEHHYVKENTDETFTCEKCPHGTGWDWSKEIGSDTTARLDTEDNDCVGFSTDCLSNHHVVGKELHCTSCNETYFGLTTNSAEPIGTHNSEQKGMNRETGQEGPGSKCRFLKWGWGGPPENDNTLKQEIENTSYGIVPSIPPPYTRDNLSAEEGFTTDDTKSKDIYDIFPSDSRNKIDHLFIRQCPPETHSASYTLTNEVFKMNQLKEGTEEFSEVSEVDNIFTQAKEYNCYRKNICSSFVEEDLTELTNKGIVRRVGTIESIFNSAILDESMTDEEKQRLNQDLLSNITCTPATDEVGELTLRCSCENDGTDCDSEKFCTFIDTTHNYKDATQENCVAAFVGGDPESCPGACNYQGPARCTGDDNGSGSPATCTGTRTTDSSSCSVITDFIANPIETHCPTSDGCTYTAQGPGVACTLNEGRSACGVQGGDCVFIPESNDGGGLESCGVASSVPCENKLTGGDGCIPLPDQDDIPIMGHCEVNNFTSFVPDKVGFGFIYSNEKDCHESKLCGENNDKQCMWFPGSKVNTFIDHASMFYQKQDDATKDEMRCSDGDCTGGDNLNGEDLLSDTHNSFDECKIKNKIAILNYNEGDDTGDTSPPKIINLYEVDQAGSATIPGLFYKYEKCQPSGSAPSSPGVADISVDNICIKDPEYNLPPGEELSAVETVCEGLNAINCENEIDDLNITKCKLQGVCYLSPADDTEIGRYIETANTEKCNSTSYSIKSICEYNWDKNRICDENDCEYYYDDRSNSETTQDLNIFKTEKSKGFPEKNAIMGYEYRKKIEDVEFKEREKNMEMEEDLKHPREIQNMDLGENINLMSTVSSEWYCDINNDVIFPPEGCSPGFYSKQESEYDDIYYRILDKKIIKDGPTYLGNPAKIEGNTSCSLCKPWRGDSSDRKLKKYSFSPSSPFYSRNGLVECLKCSNTGTCTMPKCTEGYFYDRRTRTCLQCRPIPNQDENILNYSGIYENDYPFTCTNRNDSRFNDMKVLPTDSNGSYDVSFKCEWNENGDALDPLPEPGLHRRIMKCLDGTGIPVPNYNLIKLDTIDGTDNFIDGYCDIKRELGELDSTMTFFGSTGGNVLTNMNEDENGRQRLPENDYIFNQSNNTYYRNGYFRYTVNSSESTITCEHEDCLLANVEGVTSQNSSSEKIFFVDATHHTINSIDKCYGKLISENNIVHNEIIGFNFNNSNNTCELIVKNGSEFSPSREGDTVKERFNILNLEHYTPDPKYSSGDRNINTYLVYDDYPDYPKIQCNFKNKTECENFITGNRGDSQTPRDFCKWRSLEDLIKKDCIQNYSLPNPTINDNTYISELNTILDSEDSCNSAILDDIYNVNYIEMGGYYEKQQDCNLKLLKKLQDVNSKVNHYSNYNSIFKKITDDNLSEVLDGGGTLNGKEIKKLKDTNLSKFKCGFPCKPGYYLKREQDKDQCLPCNLEGNSNNFLETDCTNNENCNLTCSIDRDGEIKGESFMCKPGYLYKNGSCISCIREGTESFLGIYSDPDPDNTDKKYYSCSIPPPDPDDPDSISPDIKITACIGSADDKTAGNVYSKVSGFCTKVSGTTDDPPRIDDLENILLNHGIFTLKDYEESNLSLEEDKDSYEKCGTCIKKTIDFQNESKNEIFTEAGVTGSRITDKENCELQNMLDNPGETYFWKTFTLDEINDNEEFDYILTEKYIWTSDKCIPCKGTWEKVRQNDADYDNELKYDRIKFKNCCTIAGCDACPDSDDVVKCPYHQNEKPSYVAELPELNNNTNNDYNKLKSLNKERHKRMPLKNTLHGVAISSTYSNKGYEPSFEPHKIANQEEGETEYYKRNNSWGIVNNDRVEDPAICERSISLEESQTSDVFRENFNSAIWPITWMGDSRGEDFDVWDNHYISLGEWNMNVDNKVNINGEETNIPFFTSPDNRGWLSAQLKTRHPVTDGGEEKAMTTFFYRPQPHTDNCVLGLGQEFQPVEPEHGAIDTRDIEEKIGGSGAEGGCASIKSVVGQDDEKTAGDAYLATAGKKVSVPYNYKDGNFNWPGVCGDGDCSSADIVAYAPWGGTSTVGEERSQYLGYLNSKYPFKHNNNLYGDKYLKWGRMKRADRTHWTAGGAGGQPNIAVYAGKTKENLYTQPRFQHSHCKNYDYQEGELKYACDDFTLNADRSLYESIGDEVGGDGEEPYGYHMQHTGDTCFSFKGGNDASFLYAGEKNRYRNLCGGNAIGEREIPETGEVTVTNLDDIRHGITRREDPVSNMKIRSTVDQPLDIDIYTNGYGNESNYPRQFGTKEDNYIVIPSSRGTTTDPPSRSMNSAINIAARQWAYISDTELTEIDDNLQSTATPNEGKGETLNTYGRDINKHVLDNPEGGGASKATGGYHSKSWHDVYKPIRATTYPFNNRGDYDMKYFDPDFSYGWSGINIDLNNVHGSDGNQVGRNITSFGIGERMKYSGTEGSYITTRTHGPTHVLDAYNTGRGIGGGGRMGGDFEYSASTLDAKRVENGIPGVCFVNRIGGLPVADHVDSADTSWVYNKGSSVSLGRSGKDVQFFDTEDNDTRTVTGGQVWTGRTYWGTKENEENWKTLDDTGSGYDDMKHRSSVLPEHDGYRDSGINKNRPLTGYMLVDLGVDKVPNEDIGATATYGIGPMKNDLHCSDNLVDVRGVCNRLKYRRDIMVSGSTYGGGGNIGEYKMGAGISGEDFNGGTSSTYPDSGSGEGSYDSTGEQCFYILDSQDIKEAGDEMALRDGVGANMGQGETSDRSLETLFRDDDGGSFTPYHIGRHYDNRMLTNIELQQDRDNTCSPLDWNVSGWIFRMDSCNAGLYTGNHWTYMHHPFEYNAGTSSHEDYMGASGLLRTNLVSEQFDEKIGDGNPGYQVDLDGFNTNIDSKFFEIKELNKGYTPPGGSSIDRGRKFSSVEIGSGRSVAPPVVAPGDEGTDDAPYDKDFQVYENINRVGAGGTSGQLAMFDQADDLNNNNVLYLANCANVTDPDSVSDSREPDGIEHRDVCKNNVNYGLDPNLYDFSQTGNKFNRQSSADKIKNGESRLTVGPAVVQAGLESTGESWTHNNISRILVDSDPIFKGVGSKTQGKETNITDKEFKTCSDYCNANPNCTGFTYRDYFTKLKDSTGASHSGFNPIYADKVNNQAGLCCLKTKDRGSKIVKGLNGANLVDDPGKNQGYYEPYTTFIQCPKDPVYSELEEKIMGVSKLNATGNIERINTMNDIYLAKKAGYKDGQPDDALRTAGASDKELIRSKTMTGQLLAALKNQTLTGDQTRRSEDDYPLSTDELGIGLLPAHEELNNHLKEISDTGKYDLRKKFSKKYAFNNTHDTNRDALYGAGKEAVGCLDVASEVNQSLKQSTIDYNHKYALRNHFLGGPLGIETYKKLSDYGSAETTEQGGVGGARAERYGNKTESALAVSNLGKIPRSGDRISNVWDSDVYPMKAQRANAFELAHHNRITPTYTR